MRGITKKIDREMKKKYSVEKIQVELINNMIDEYMGENIVKGDKYRGILRDMMWIEGLDEIKMVEALEHTLQQGLEFNMEDLVRHLIEEGVICDEMILSNMWIAHKNDCEELVCWMLGQLGEKDYALFDWVIEDIFDEEDDGEDKDEEEKERVKRRYERIFYEL